MRIHLVEWRARGSNERIAFARYVDHLRRCSAGSSECPTLVRSVHSIAHLRGSCLWATDTLTPLFKELRRWHSHIAYQISPCFQPENQLQQMARAIPLVAGPACLHLTCDWSTS